MAKVKIFLFGVVNYKIGRNANGIYYLHCGMFFLNPKDRAAEDGLPRKGINAMWFDVKDFDFPPAVFYFPYFHIFKT